MIQAATIGLGAVLIFVGPLLLTTGEAVSRESAKPGESSGIGEGKAARHSSALEVVESTFCLKMDRPRCDRPAARHHHTVTEIETVEKNIARLYFWTSIKATEDMEIMHVWSSSDRPDGPWAEPIHISLGDKLKNMATYLSNELAHISKFLYLIKNENPSIQNVQGLPLFVERSKRFRTYSSLRAVPGKYSVEVRYVGTRELVPGGEAKTITIRPPSESD